MKFVPRPVMIWRSFLGNFLLGNQFDMHRTKGIDQSASAFAGKNELSWKPLHNRDLKNCALQSKDQIVLRTLTWSRESKSMTYCSTFFTFTITFGVFPPGKRGIVGLVKFDNLLVSAWGFGECLPQPLDMIESCTWKVNERIFMNIFLWTPNLIFVDIKSDEIMDCAVIHYITVIPSITKQQEKRKTAYHPYNIENSNSNTINTKCSHHQATPFIESDDCTYIIKTTPIDGQTVNGCMLSDAPLQSSALRQPHTTLLGFLKKVKQCMEPPWQFLD